MQSGVGGPQGRNGGGILDELQQAFTGNASTLWLLGLVLAAYALLEGIEAVGLWRANDGPNTSPCRIGTSPRTTPLPPYRATNIPTSY